MRLIVIFLVFNFVGSAAADEFGTRFSGNPPAAFMDGGSSIFLRNIEPAAGEEETGSAAEASNDTIFGPPTFEEFTLKTDNKQANSKPISSNGLIRIYPKPLKK